MVNIIPKYFPHLSPAQQQQLAALGPLYTEWNEKINVISRKDIENLYERHILHSLAIAKVINFTPGTQVLDVGTGGGFPGIPLAILFPETDFVLVDSVGKKIKVVQAVAEAIGLKNVKAIHGRAEELRQKFDFVTGRAVTDLIKFAGWVRPKIKKQQQNGLPNGIIYLKGLEHTHEEAKHFGPAYQIYPIKDFFDEEYFDTKAVVYLELSNLGCRLI